MCSARSCMIDKASSYSANAAGSIVQQRVSNVLVNVYAVRTYAFLHIKHHSDGTELLLVDTSHNAR
jgi:hypothetical protein